MSFNVSRRWFIGGLASAGALGGCRIFKAAPGQYSGGRPNLTFGVVSDVHVRAALEGTGLADGYCTTTLEHTFAWFRDQGVDAVMIAGDIADKGLVEELEAVAAAWFKVFPGDRAPDGRHVERLFVYGNHDWEGYRYGKFGEKKYPDSAELARHLLCTDQKGHWERIFHEPWSRVYRKDVKGYAFIGGHWTADKCRGAEERGVPGVQEFFATQKGQIDPALPFFYFQHPHPKNTCYGSWAWGHDVGEATRALSTHPNAIAFSGHSHYSLTDERSIWQGAFTSLGTSSLRYTALTYEGVEEGYENGNSVAYATYNPYKVMEKIYTRDHRQGMLVRVYGDHVSFTRREFVGDGSLGDDWVMPLPAAESRPFAYAARAKKVPVPEFPAGSTLSVKKVRAKNRGLKDDTHDIPSVEKDAYELSFPAANAVAGGRAVEYQMSAVPKDGGKTVVRYMVPEGWDMPAAHKLAQARARFLVAADQLPSGDFTFEVRPRNSFGKAGAPLVAPSRA